jgi:hypothetical protein
MARWILAAAFAASGVAADAHHSLYGVYHTDRRATVEGVVAQFHFVNPHPFLIVEARDAGGRPQQWRMEMDNRRELVDVGLTEHTFKPGDKVVVSGSPGRSEQILGLYVRRLDRPADGLRYEQIGTSPRLIRR